MLSRIAGASRRSSPTAWRPTVDGKLDGDEGTGRSLVGRGCLGGEELGIFYERVGYLNMGR